MKHVLKNTISLILAAIFLVLLLAACGGTSSASTGSTSGASSQEAASTSTQVQEVTLGYTWWGNQVRAERTTAVTEMYTALHPEVTFALEYCDGGSYNDLITTRAAGGDLPDLIQVDYDAVPRYADKGLLIPLDEYVEAGIIDLSKCDANTIAAGTVDGSLYALSMGNNARCMFYDASLLQELGLTISMEPTWEEFKEIGQKVYEATGIKTSYCWQITYAETLRNTIRGAGYEFYNEEQTALGFDDPTIIERAYQELAEAGAAEWVVDPSEYAGITGSELEPIVASKAWNAFLTSNMGVGLQSAMGEDRTLGICMQPTFSDKSRQPCYVQPSQLTGLGSSGTDAEKKAAAAALNYIINDIDANKVLLNERGVSMNSEVCEAIANDLDEVSQKISDYVTYVAEHGAPAPALEPACSSEIFELEKNIRQKVLFGAETPEDAAAEFMQGANKILAENAG